MVRKSAEVVPPRVSRKRYVGEVVYLYAFDVAYEMTREPVREVLGQPVCAMELDADKRTPRLLTRLAPLLIVGLPNRAERANCIGNRTRRAFGRRAQ